MQVIFKPDMGLNENGSQRLQTIMKKVKEILEKKHNLHINIETDLKKKNYQCRFCFQVPLTFKNWKLYIVICNKSPELITLFTYFYFLTFRGPCIMIYSYNETNEMR